MDSHGWAFSLKKRWEPKQRCFHLLSVLGKLALLVRKDLSFVYSSPHVSKQPQKVFTEQNSSFCSPENQAIATGRIN